MLLLTLYGVPPQPPCIQTLARDFEASSSSSCRIDPDLSSSWARSSLVVFAAPFVVQRIAAIHRRTRAAALDARTTAGSDRERPSRAEPQICHSPAPVRILTKRTSPQHNLNSTLTAILTPQALDCDDAARLALAALHSSLLTLSTPPSRLAASLAASA